jgi:hypothetical protein
MLGGMTPRERLILIVPGVLFLVAFGAFELGRWAGEREARRKAAAPPDEGVQSDGQLMETLLAQNLDERTFAFSGVIAGATGTTVRQLDPGEPAAATILAAIREAADHTLAVHNGEQSPIRGLARINEASRHFEDTLRERLDAHPDLFCTVPHLEDGSEQRAGYPDLRIEHVETGTIAYLDPKLFEADSRDSSLRTFYYTPRTESSKVREDAHHLILGISHDGADGRWTFTGWELIDLARLEVRLKAEFQASNRDLYRPETRLARSRPAD